MEVVLGIEYLNGNSGRKMRSNIMTTIPYSETYKWIPVPKLQGFYWVDRVENLYTANSTC